LSEPSVLARLQALVPAGGWERLARLRHVPPLRPAVTAGRRSPPHCRPAWN